MRTRILTLSMVLVLAFLSACGSAAQPGTSPTATVPDTPAPAGVDLPANAAEILSKALAQISETFGIAASDITVKSMESTMWPDACLGVSTAGMMCAQVVTPGYLVILDTPQGEMEVHTNETGDNFRIIPPAGSDPNAPAIVFEESGGIAGICYTLTVDYKGAYSLQDCKKNDAPLTGNLEPGTMATLSGWLNRYGSFLWESANPAGSADMFNYHLIFNGKGSETADADLQQEILQFLGNLVSQLSSAGQTSNVTGSGIEGQVLIGPACPGPTRVGSPCPDQPYQASFIVLTSANEQVTQFKTDEQGQFRISLSPGTYILHPVLEGAYPRASDQGVTVAAGKYTNLQIIFDSGMR